MEQFFFRAFSRFKKVVIAEATLFFSSAIFEVGAKTNGKYGDFGEKMGRLIS